MKHKILILVISLILLISTALHPSPLTNNKELLKLISNSQIKINYFFLTKKEKAFLIKTTDDISFQVWNYTDERKWKPLHNTGSFDGFKKALKNISKITRDKTHQTISFGHIIKDTMIDNDILELLKIIENRTLATNWYFWTKDNNYFLFKEKKYNGISIWNYTNDRKWKPLHNTGAFDGFDGALKTLQYLKFDSSSDSLITGSLFFNDIHENNKDAFIVKIDTHLKKEYAIFTNSDYVYNYSVDCNNDGINEAENLNSNYTCKYDRDGFYNVAINGIYPHKGYKTIEEKQAYYSQQADNNRQIREIKQWGNIEWKSMEYAFYTTDYPALTAKDVPNLKNVRSMKHMFDFSNFKRGMDISNWDVSSVTNMNYMFAVSGFDLDISKWDVSNVTDMSYMFYQSKSFNKDISNWDVSSVTNMKFMFYLAPFDDDISKWDVSNVTNMSYMFDYSHFNQDISNWDVSSVTNMNYMFNRTRFNQDISRWDVSNVVYMDRMFKGSPFNQDISKWDVSNVSSMASMFKNSQFNQDISKWNVSSVSSMSRMFNGSIFNQDISNWDISNVYSMTSMFKDSQFNQDISKWDISNVYSMTSMFKDSQFNQDISKWNVFNVFFMEDMFNGSIFNQDISKWNIASNTRIKDMFKNTKNMEEKNKPKKSQNKNDRPEPDNPNKGNSLPP